jgi:SM-20-related protein
VPTQPGRPMPSFTKDAMATAIAPAVRSAGVPDDATPDSLLRYDLLTEVEVVQHPFEYFAIPRFVREEHLAAIHRDFPIINQGGSFPLSALRYGPAFAQLTDELLGDRLRKLLARKFEMDFTGRPATLTVRGCTRLKDGQIHTDSASKLITVLLYLNRDWNAAGGRLRLLHNSHDIDNIVAEVPPEEGSLLAFRCRENAWHGHQPFDGPRRSLQLNYVTSEGASHWSHVRHTLSAMLKGLRG